MLMLLGSELSTSYRSFVNCSQVTAMNGRDKGKRKARNLKHPFDPRRRMFRSSTVKPMWEHHDDPALFEPFGCEEHQFEGEQSLETAEYVLSEEEMYVSMITCAPLKKSPNYPAQRQTTHTTSQRTDKLTCASQIGKRFGRSQLAPYSN